MKINAIRWNKNKNIIVYLLVWTWTLNFRQLVSPKCWCLCSILHGVTSRNIVVFIYWYLWSYILYLQITEQISLVPVESLGRVIGYLDSGPLCFLFHFFFTYIYHYYILPITIQFTIQNSLTGSCYTDCNINGRMFHTNLVNAEEVK